MANTISNMDDTIDSRDIIERIEELEGARDALQSALDDAETAFNESEEDAVNVAELENEASAARGALAEWDASEEADELRTLQSLAEEAEGYCPDWTYGAQLIRDSYFEQAMDEMIDDCYGSQYTKDLPSFMTITLDYSALQQDYTSVEFDGVTYWVR